MKAAKKIVELFRKNFFSDESKEKINPELNLFTLRFNGDSAKLEKKYIDSFKKNFKKQTQFAHIIGLLFYAGFSFLDKALAPEFADDFLFIRLAIIVPLIIISLVFTFTKAFLKYMQPFLSLLMFIVGLGIVAMIVIGGPQINSMYYPGLILVFVFAYTFIGLSFIWATVTTWGLLLVYEIVSIYTFLPEHIFIGTNFFLISILIFTMIAGYSVEYYRRSEFFTNHLLETEKKKIRLDNFELERRVKVKTAEFLKAKEQAEKSDKLKSIFLAQMSHEIRTPINAVLSLTSLIKDDIQDKIDEETKLSFKLVERAGIRIIRTIDLLLNLSEIQAGTYEVIMQRVDLYADILGKIIVNFKKEAKDKGLKFELDIATGDTEIIADSYTVEQIFTQLIENAIKYTNEGSVSIKLYRKNEKMIVEVKDTGIGIAEEYLPELFEPFTQEEMGYTRKYEGNGLGLSLVKKYCELNNAEIEVESKKMRGSVFRVIFNA